MNETYLSIETSDYNYFCNLAQEFDVEIIDQENTSTTNFMWIKVRYQQGNVLYLMGQRMANHIQYKQIEQ